MVRATAVLILIGQDNIYYVDSRYSILLSIMTFSHAVGLDYRFLQPSSKNDTEELYPIFEHLCTSNAAAALSST